MKIKICGIRDPETARVLAACEVDMAGFVFAASPRRVTPRAAARIARELPPGIERVAVFRLANAETIRRVLDVFPADRVQVETNEELRLAEFADRLLPVLHDDRTLQRQVAALVGVTAGSVKPGVRAAVLEAAGRGGRGVAPSMERAARVARRIPLLLAGGLTPATVGEAIRRVRPWGVDVSSGVETEPGVKGAEMIEAFVAAVRTSILEEV